MNALESLVSAEFIRAFAWTLFHSLWQGGILALIAAGILFILRKHRPGIRYAILYILMLCLPVFFVGTFLTIYHPGNININPAAQASGTLWQTENTLAGNLKAIPVTELPHAWYAYLVHLFENQAKWLVLFWFTGFFILLLRFSGSFLYVYRLKNYQVYNVDEQWNDKIHKLSGNIGLERTVKLAESALARIPITIGYFKPVILLPVGTLSGVPPQQIDAILLHELAHILRKDYLLNIIQSVIELLFFYHPVTWWLSGLIRQEREHICDDLAVAVNQDHINYIKALTTMEELNAKSPLLASAIAGSKKKLLCRVKRLLSPVKLRKGFSEGIIAFVLLIGLILTLSLNALSFIPNAYDLTGRETGEKVYSLVKPDTITAISKSGKVAIKVYTDSTSKEQQEMLNRMAESMDKQANQHNKAIQEYQIQVERFDDERGRCENECKVVIVRTPDTAASSKDSVIIIYDGSNSIDTLLFLGPEGHLYFDNQDMELSAKQWEEQMNDFQRDMERQQHDAERQQREAERQQRDEERMYRDQSGNSGIPQPDPFIYNAPIPGHPVEPQWHEFNPGPRIAPAEKIIRQELVDDGLATPHKKYVIELDSKAMYINGEKQSKDTYRKYKHLAESLDVANLEGDSTYKLIF